VKALAIAVIAACAALVSCSAQEDTQVAERGVMRFHEQFNAGQYAEVFAEGDALFREGGEGAFVGVMQKLKERFGDVRQSELMNSKWQTGNVLIEERMVSGTIVVMAYRTEFTRASATETFTWRIAQGRATLMGYVNDTD
jgi:hypothetical protein